MTVPDNNTTYSAATQSVQGLMSAADKKKLDGIAAGAQVNPTSVATLTTARTFLTNLASTAAASFNGSANVTPGVTGILPVANGGTGNSEGTARLKSEGFSSSYANIDALGSGLFFYNRSMKVGTVTSSTWVLLSCNYTNASYGFQLIVPTGFNYLFYRVKVNGSWAAWKAITAT